MTLSTFGGALGMLLLAFIAFIGAHKFINYFRSLKDKGEGRGCYKK